MNKEKNFIIDEPDIKAISEAFTSIKAVLKKYGEVSEKENKIEAQSRFKNIFEMDFRDTQINTLVRRLGESLYDLLSVLAYPENKEDMDRNSKEYEDLIILLEEYLKKLKKEAIKEGIFNLKERGEFVEDDSERLKEEAQKIQEEVQNLEESYDSLENNEDIEARSKNESDKKQEQNLESDDGLKQEDAKENDNDVLEIKNIIEKRRNKFKKIEARKINSKGGYNLNFNLTSDDFFKIDIESKKVKEDKIPIKGVLFEIDKPSEEIPSVGPNMPLYISRNVAEKVQKSIVGYPLDADPSLSKHEKSNIVGIIENAYIEGNNFIIEGNLWFNNKEDQIQKIIDQKEMLGLSMNADASGHIQNIENKKVFYIDDLFIWGANILYLNLATYQKAKILAKNKKNINDEPQQENYPQVIAGEYAIKAEKSNLEDKTMDEATKTEILSSLKSLHESFNEQQKIQAEKNKALEEDLDSIKSVVKKYEEERQQVEAQKKQETTQQQKEEDQKQLIEALKSEMGSMISEQIEEIKNPSGEPRRKTKSQSTHNKEKASSESNEVRDLQLQLSKIQGALEHAQSLPFEKQLALQEEKTQLENKLSILA